MAMTKEQIYEMQKATWDKAVEGQVLVDLDDLVRAAGDDPDEVAKRAVRSARARRAAQARWDRQRSAG